MEHPLDLSELPRPIPRDAVESDDGCTLKIYFDNAGNNMTLTLYNVTLTSQKLCEHNNICDCSKTNGLNEENKLCIFSTKYRYFIEKA